MAAVNIKLNPVGIAVVGVVTIAIVVYTTGFPFNTFGSGSDSVDLRELLSVSVDLAQRAGVKVKEIRLKKNAMHEQVKGKTMEGAKEMLTDGDLQSHRTLVFGLAKAFPKMNVISEEHDTKKLDADYIADANKNLPDVALMPNEIVPKKNLTVWIDPLDATQEYTEDLLEYVTVMVCVAVNGVPTIGVIHKPFFEDAGATYWGWVEKGHSPNLFPARTPKTGGEYNIIVSRSHAGPVEEVTKTALGPKTKIIPAGGAGYKTLEVISGKADAYVHVTAIKKWDICAGNAIINSVKGRMTNLHDEKIEYGAEGSPLNDNGLLATLFNHETFLKSVKPAFDKEKEKNH